jgi:hypothetical protein
MNLSVSSPCRRAWWLRPDRHHGSIFDDLWIIRTNIDGMVHWRRQRLRHGQRCRQWSPTSIHAQLQLAPATLPMTATATDAMIAATAINATNSLLTD